MTPFDDPTLPKPQNEVFRASALQREYRRVLDAARDGPVQILDKDDTLLGIERWDDLVFARGVLAALDHIGQFHAVHSRHRDEHPTKWASMTPFPWLAEFGISDVDQFATELLPHLFAALRRKSLDPYLGNLRAWESSAEMLDDEEMIAATSIELGDADLFEISPPSPDEVDREAARATDGKNTPS